MDRAAGEGPIVFAGPANPTRAAPVPGTVDRAEGRGSQGDEEPGPLANCDGDVLAADQARADKVEGVACVESGARGADGGASVAAADGELFSRLVTGVVAVQNLAGRPVQSGGRAGQMDGVSASADGGDLFQPAGELGVLGDADCVAVCFGELAQARRAVEGGAPVSRGELGCDGGDLPGWAAEAARVMVGGAQSVMWIAPSVGGAWLFSGWFRHPGTLGSGEAVRSRFCGLRRPCRRGISREAWAWRTSFLLRCGRSR